MSARGSQSPESVVREIRRNTRRKYTSEEKIRIVLEGLKGEVSIVELCRREGIVSNLYYRWSKYFLEAAQKRLAMISRSGTFRSLSTTCSLPARSLGYRRLCGG